MRLRVGSLASLRGLRIQHCRELWCRLKTQLRSGVAVAVVEAGSNSSNSTPSLRTSIGHGYSPEKDKKTKKKKMYRTLSQRPLRTGEFLGVEGTHTEWLFSRQHKPGSVLPPIYAPWHFRSFLHMAVSRLGVQSDQSYSCQPTPQPQQCRIQATSGTYTTAHGNTGSLGCRAGPAVEPMSSWILIRFVSSEPRLELLESFQVAFPEFPLWLSGLRTWHRLCKDVGSIPGLAQWVKDWVLL